MKKTQYYIAKNSSAKEMYRQGNSMYRVAVGMSRKQYSRKKLVGMILSSALTFQKI